MEDTAEYNAKKETTKPKETREQKVARLKAQLEKEEALLKEDTRKKRDGELVAFGILVEQMFKNGDESARQKWLDGANKHLDGRNLKRVLSGFQRLTNG